MKINSFFENKENYVYIIAEVAQNHDGSLGQAHAFIDAISNTGADAVKFQTHIADAESTRYEPFRVKFSYEDKNRYEYWKRMEFSAEQWNGLYTHAEEMGLEFLSSPFSIEAFDLLNDIGVSAWKLGSGEVFNQELLKKMVFSKKPILLSTGLSSIGDIRSQINIVKKGKNKLGILQCTSRYPTLPEQVGLNVINELKAEFACCVGLSDHSGEIYPSLAAVALGARIIEVHVTLSKYMFGPDISSSLDIEQLKALVKGVRMISVMLNHPINKNEKTEYINKMKKIFSKGIYLTCNLSGGTILQKNMLSQKKPECGVNADCLEKVLGKKLKFDKKKDSPLRWEDITEE